MHLLPFEICNFIFSLLDYKSCLECSVVCKYWHQRLEQSGILYKTIHCTDLRQHEVMKRFFKDNKEASNKVNTLQYTIPLSTLEIDTLNQCFPNIEEFQLMVTSRFCHFSNFEERALTRPPHWPYLKRLRESTRDMYSFGMLQYHSLEHLVHIDINFIHLTPMERSASTFLCSYVANAPHLNTLTLWWPQLNYLHLDQLHKNCTHLKELTLFHPTFLRHPIAPHTGYHDPLPSIHYTPDVADGLGVFQSYDTLFEGSIPLLSYIAAKYKRLSTLVVTAKDKTDKRSQSHIMDLNVDEMKKFECDLVDMTPELLQRFTALELTSFDILRHTRAVEMLRVMVGNTKLRMSIKHLLIQSCRYTPSCFEYIGRFENLERLVLEPKSYLYHMGEYEEEEEGYIEEGEGYGLEEEEEEVVVVEDQIEEEEEEMEMEELSISLNILNQLPKLKHLSIHWFQLDDHQIHPHTSLETLQLMDCTIKNDSLKKLLSSCLQLKKLTLFCWLSQQQKHKIRVSLRNHQLLEKIDIWIKGYPTLRFHDEDENKQWFEVERHGQFVTYYPSSKKKKTNYFFLECASTDLFYVPERYSALYH